MSARRRKINEELRAISPELPEIPRNDMQVPRGYFDRLETEILLETTGHAPRHIHHSPKMRALYFSVAAAAVFALAFFGIRYQLLNGREKPGFEVQLASLNTQELNAYMELQEKSMSAEALGNAISRDIRFYRESTISEPVVQMGDAGLDSLVNSLKPAAEDILGNDKIIDEMDEDMLLKNIDASDLENAL